VELGVTVLRVNPTVNLADGTATAEWLEAGLSGNVKGMAQGLSLFAEGLGSISLATKAVEFATRLVKAADAVTDSSWDQVVLKSDFLSHLANLGGTYASLQQISSPNNPGFFLRTLWEANTPQSIQQGSLEMTGHLKQFVSPQAYLSAMVFSRNALVEFRNSQRFSLQIQDSYFSQNVFEMSHNYSGLSTSGAEIISQEPVDALLARFRPTNDLIANSVGDQIEELIGTLKNIVLAVARGILSKPWRECWGQWGGMLLPTAIQAFFDCYPTPFDAACGRSLEKLIPLLNSFVQCLKDKGISGDDFNLRKIEKHRNSLQNHQNLLKNLNRQA
jgi:hypothetical protein